jgi:hypothetical protein
MPQIARLFRASYAPLMQHREIPGFRFAAALADDILRPAGLQPVILELGQGQNRAYGGVHLCILHRYCNRTYGMRKPRISGDSHSRSIPRQDAVQATSLKPRTNFPIELC